MENNNNKTILIYGLPCSGKTTLAKALSTKINASLLSTEQLWALLFNVKESAEDKDFSAFELDIVYKSIVSLMEILLEKNHSVVVEGVFRSNIYRELVEEIALKYNSKFIVICLEVNDDVANYRLICRKNQGTISPAGPKVYLEIKKNYPLKKDTHMRIDTSHKTDLEVFMEVVESINVWWK